MIAESAEGDVDAARRRLEILYNVPKLVVDSEAEALAAHLIVEGGFPEHAKADALHVALSSVHSVDYLLTWNCRHINNAVTKPLIRSICAISGYVCPEICTPQELLLEESDDVPG